MVSNANEGKSLRTPKITPLALKHFASSPDCRAFISAVLRKMRDAPSAHLEAISFRRAVKYRVHK